MKAPNMHIQFQKIQSCCRSWWNYYNFRWDITRKKSNTKTTIKSNFKLCLHILANLVSTKEYNSYQI